MKTDRQTDGWMDRQMDHLFLFFSGGSSAYMTNPKRFPTMLRILVYSEQGVGSTVVGFLRRFDWTNIALICDDNPGLGDFVQFSCRGFYTAVKTAAGMTIDDFHFDSQRTPDVDYGHFLTLAAQKSRSKATIELIYLLDRTASVIPVILICGHGTRTRDMLVQDRF